MRITINPVLDMETLQWVSNSGVYEHTGTIMLFCSSGGEIAQSDEALQKAQTTMTNSLNADYTTSFAEQQQILAQQQAKLNYIAANPMGYTPEQLHTATTAINENTATAAKQAMGAAAAYAAAHGGADTGSGPAGMTAGQIASAAGQSKAQQLAALSEQSQQMKQQNLWSALSGLNSVGSQYGGSAGTAIQGAGSAAGTAVNAGEGALKAQQAGWQDFAGVLSGVAGLATAASGFNVAGGTSQPPNAAGGTGDVPEIDIAPDMQYA